MPFPINIILVGFMGSGKTSTGKELAKLLKYRFIDLDQWIENKNKIKIPIIFNKYGEDYFRKEEKKAVDYLVNKKRYVVSTGGGVWLNKENRNKLSKLGYCIWLVVSPAECFKRTRKNIANRPLLNKSNPLKSIKQLMVIRNKYYSMAKMKFNSDGKSPRKVAREIFAYFGE
jgi:shikimate kinase